MACPLQNNSGLVMYTPVMKFGSGEDLLPGDTKFIPGPMLTYHKKRIVTNPVIFYGIKKIA